MFSLLSLQVFNKPIAVMVQLQIDNLSLFKMQSFSAISMIRLHLDKDRYYSQDSCTTEIYKETRQRTKLEPKRINILSWYQRPNTSTHLVTLTSLDSSSSAPEIRFLVYLKLHKINEKTLENMFTLVLVFRRKMLLQLAIRISYRNKEEKKKMCSSSFSPVRGGRTGIG